MSEIRCTSGFDNLATQGKYKDAIFEKLATLESKLQQIGDIAHWRMGEVDIHLKNRLGKIQKIIRDEE